MNIRGSVGGPVAHGQDTDNQVNISWEIVALDELRRTKRQKYFTNSNNVEMIHFNVLEFA